MEKINPEKIHWSCLSRTGKILPILFLLSVIAGCAGRLPKYGAPRVFAPPLQTREEINQLLFRDYGKLNSLKATGEIEFRQAGEEAWRGASIILLAEKPNKVRARAYRLLTPTLFEFVSDNQDCWLFLPSERTVYYDNNCGIFQKKADHLVLSAEMIDAALFVINDFDRFRQSSAAISESGDILKLSLMNEAGRYREIWIDKSTGLVTKQFFLNSEGLSEAEIQYLEQAAHGEVVVPVEVEVTLPQAQAAMRLRLTEVDLQPNINPDTFHFTPPSNARIVPVAGMQE
jgi:outer membrane lipoprotein-sorting protein